MEATNDDATEKATLGGGCFWCLEAVYNEVIGVKKVVSGYSGGEIEHPTYDRVCSGTTGHAEVVQIIYDPSVITYEEILTIFFHFHDPTTLNRQGADSGSQYRSVILYHNDQQKSVAQKVMKEVSSSGLWKNPLVTELAPLTTFYSAEDYHQDYFTRNPNQPYCVYVVAPKLEKFRKSFSVFRKK